MTDQQDLRARLLEECDRKESIPTRVPTMNPRTRFVHSDRVRNLLREAATQLGRVGDETIDCEIAVAPATIFSVGVKLSTVVSAVRARKEAEGTFAFTAKVRDRVAEPQLPAGVPDVGVGVDVTSDGTHVVVRQRDTIVYSQFHPLATPQPDSAESDCHG